MLDAKLKPVLLVEDDIVDAMTVRRALKELKVKNELVHTTDGKKALEYLRTAGNPKPCVIFLDLNMPEMNGIEFLQIIKADGALKSIPVVMLAASSEEKNIVETFNLGVAGYIFKPVDAKKLDEFKPVKMFWTTEQRRTLICLLLLMYLIVANTGYNIRVAEKGAPVWKYFAADVIHDLWTARQKTATAMGTVVGILYGRENPCVLINRELVYEGDITKGVRVVRINRDEVEFEKNGRRWTQKALASPNDIWKTPKSLTG
ncbi:MAG: response regulator [Sedimentisphaerales bacterium]|nr:response regulator [Sedimentisphaerales bacterium]